MSLATDRSQKGGPHSLEGFPRHAERVLGDCFLPFHADLVSASLFRP
jgi:hypothetical protein